MNSSRIADEARDLAIRISEGRIYIACTGQFKRGKSTLINALMGDAVLPVGFTPVTAVPTVIRLGDRPRARVQVGDGCWQDVSVAPLNEYVSEGCNPENTKGVRGVEIFAPSSPLAGGICFVGTPGLGSVFSGNTAATPLTLVPPGFGVDCPRRDPVEMIRSSSRSASCFFPDGREG